jgi:glyoxylase-like metal-dependent hydrolase (beta-lactamase superfamily II)
VDGTHAVAPGVEVFLTGGHSKGHQGVRLTGTDGVVVLHMGDVVSTVPQLRPLWVSALDDYPLDSIEAKRRWVGEAIAGGWWMVFYHDFRYLAGQCDAEYQLLNALEARKD